MRNILAIDTAMNACSACVYDKARGVFTARSLPMERGHSEALMPLVEESMKESGLAYSDLEAVAVTVGPGAFTGLRIGISAAKALGLALGIPVLGVSTLDALARAEKGKSCAALIDDKRGGFYARFYDEKGSPLTDAMILAEKEIASHLREGMVVADAAPKGEIICALAEENPLPAEPVYLRGADVSAPKTKPRALSSK